MMDEVIQELKRIRDDVKRLQTRLMYFGEHGAPKAALPAVAYIVGLLTAARMIFEAAIASDEREDADADGKGEAG